VARAIARVAPGRAVLVIEHDAQPLTVAHRTVALRLDPDRPATPVPPVAVGVR
jgi:hypothetical protein